jgi:hypothetical protein
VQIAIDAGTRLVIATASDALGLLQVRAWPG